VKGKGESIVRGHGRNERVEGREMGDGEQKQKKRGKGCKIRGNGRIMGEKGRTKERKG